MMPKSKSVSIVVCGEAGQGIQTVESLLAKCFKSSGYNVFAVKEYMSRIRGGSNSTEIRVSEEKIAAYVSQIDILIPLDKDAIPHLQKRISKDTKIIGEKSKLETTLKIIDVPLTEISTAIGGVIYSNTISASIIFSLFALDINVVSQFIGNYFKAKGQEIVDKNILAAKKGFEIGEQIKNSNKIEYKLKPDSKVNDEIIVSGAEAIAMGAIAGGCNFISAYPMTPSTGIFTFLAQHAKEFNIICEQAEDEISGMNMALGAWYAGARALVNTSGGGFDLMTEGLSLAGMLESPVVINLGQRPGPATGLPTRTEQGELELALYAGHSEFPRIILAPGNLEDAFYLTNKAFNMADKFQVPVFILSDQFLADSYNNIPAFDVSKTTIENHVVKTSKEYKRYAITDSGISPRGIPGNGAGLVVLDSDEHDEEGHITENLDVRNEMVRKRLRKYDEIKKEIIPPELIGSKGYKNLIVAWGSTYPVICEALNILENKDFAFLYFKQVYPIHPDTSKYLKKAKQVLLIENNATAQFGKLLKLYADFDIQRKLLKYNGLPFSAEEIIEELKR